MIKFILEEGNERMQDSTGDELGMDRGSILAYKEHYQAAREEGINFETIEQLEEYVSKL